MPAMSEKSIEDTYNELRNLLKKYELAGEKHEAFLAKMEEGLYHFIFEYWPELSLHKDLVAEKFREVCSKCALEVFNVYGLADYRNEYELPFDGELVTPKLGKIEKEDSDVLLMVDCLRKIGNSEVREFLDKRYKYNYSQDARFSNFSFHVHEKLKEIMVEFYTGELVELDSHFLKFIDHQLYFGPADNFDQALRTILYEIREHINFFG